MDVQQIKVGGQNRYSWPAHDVDGDSADDFKPLSRDEARRVVQKSVLPSPWVILTWQAVVGVLLATVLAIVGDRPAMFESALFGCFAVVLPGIVFARGLQRQQAMSLAGAALSGFFVWELVKIVLVVVLLAAAPLLMANLSWLALLAGLVATLKASWLVLLWHSRGRAVAQKF